MNNIDTLKQDNMCDLKIAIDSMKKIHTKLKKDFQLKDIDIKAYFFTLFASIEFQRGEYLNEKELRFVLQLFVSKMTVEKLSQFIKTFNKKENFKWLFSLMFSSQTVYDASLKIVETIFLSNKTI